MKNVYLNDSEIEQTENKSEIISIKIGQVLTQLYLKSDVIFLADVFKNYVKVSFNEFDISPLFCVSLLGYTWQRGLNYTDIRLSTLQAKSMILLLENVIRGDISSVTGDT